MKRFFLPLLSIFLITACHTEQANKMQEEASAIAPQASGKVFDLLDHSATGIGFNNL